MAQQTTVKRAVNGVDKAPPRAPKAAAKGGRVFDYTKFRQSFRSDRDFAQYLAGYPNKTGILAYVYRLRPAIDMSLIGVSENSILKTSNTAEMCQEFIASRFGRGKYLLKLSDANRPRGETEACRTWFEVDDPDLTPIYDPRTLKLGDVENQDEVARLLQAGILVRDSNGGAPRFRTAADAEIAAAAGVGVQPSQPPDLLGRDLLSQVLLKVVTQGSQAPAEVFKQAVDMARMMQPAQAPINVEQVVEQVAARLQRTTTVQDGAGDFITQYDRWDAFVQKVRGPAAPAPAALPEGASPGLAVAAQVLGFLDTLVPKVFLGLQQLQQYRAQRPGKRVSRLQAAAPESGGQQQEMSVQEQIAQIAIMGFKKMQENVNGHDFAAFVCWNIQNGLEIFRMLELQGVPGVMGLCAMDNRTAAFLTDTEKRAQVERFLAEFFSFDSSVCDGSEGDPPPAAAGSAV